MHICSKVASVAGVEPKDTRHLLPVPLATSLEVLGVGFELLLELGQLGAAEEEGEERDRCSDAGRLICCAHACCRNSTCACRLMRVNICFASRLDAGIIGALEDLLGRMTPCWQKGRIVPLLAMRRYTMPMQLEQCRLPAGTPTCIVDYQTNQKVASCIS